MHIDLESREEIRAVIMKLARGTDRRDSELIKSCYHEDGYDDHGGFQGSGAEFSQWVPETLAIFESTMHVVANIHIEINGDTAHTKSYCTAHHIFPASDPEGARDSIMGLRYIDRFERRDTGGWLIANRICAYDYTYVLPINESWPLEPPYIRGMPGPNDPSYRNFN